MVFDIDEINNSWLNMIFGFGSKEVLNKLFKTVPEYFWEFGPDKNNFGFDNLEERLGMFQILIMWIPKMVGVRSTGGECNLLG